MRVLPALLLLFLIVPTTAQEDTPPVPQPRPSDAERASGDGARPTQPGWVPSTVTAPAAPATETPKPAPEAPVAVDPAADGTVPLPRPRPEPKPVTPSEAPANAAEPPPAAGAAATEGAAEEPAKPVAEPRIYQTACPAVLLGQVEAKVLPPISEGQCGTQSPLSVTGVLTNGRMVPLSGPATLTCGMASVLPTWVSAVDSYLKGHDNTEIESVIVGTSYMCRNVNNASTGNLSDHAFADALDVVGFKLKDGRTVTILEGWPGTPEQGSSIVRYAHDAACSSFMTVLGPEANALHRDHLHVDLLCHGKNCTARLCE